MNESRNSCTHPLIIHSYKHPSIHPDIHLFILPSTLSSIHPSILTPIHHPSIHQYISIHSSSFHSSSHLFIHQSISPSITFIHPSILPCNQVSLSKSQPASSLKPSSSSSEVGQTPKDEFVSLLQRQPDGKRLAVRSLADSPSLVLRCTE